MMKRFCWNWSIATGIQVYGYLLIFEFVFIVALYAALEMYEYIALVVLPAIVFIVFLKMMKKDGCKARRRFFCLWVLTQFSVTAILGA